MRIFLLILFGLISTPLYAQTPHVVGVGCLDTKNCQIPELESFLTEMYSRIGRAVSFQYYPLLRSQALANEGQIDGCSVKSKLSIADSPNLIIVPTPIIDSPHVGFSLDPALAALPLDQYPGLRVGITRGNIVGKHELTTRGIAYLEMTALDQAFEMLMRNRLDVVIVEPEVGKAVLERLEIESVTHSDPLFFRRGHHVLHTSHRDLVPLLDQAIKDMHHDGTAHRLAGRYRHILPRLAK